VRNLRLHGCVGTSPPVDQVVRETRCDTSTQDVVVRTARGLSLARQRVSAASHCRRHAMFGSHSFVPVMKHRSSPRRRNFTSQSVKDSMSLAAAILTFTTHHSGHTARSKCTVYFPRSTQESRSFGKHTGNGRASLVRTTTAYYLLTFVPFFFQRYPARYAS